AIATGMLFGVGPAWMASHTDPAEALRGAVRVTGESRALPQRSLIVLQAAVSLVLLSIAALLTETLRNLDNQEYGIQRQGRLLVQFSPQSVGYRQERLMGLYQQIDDKFSHLPGVVTASLSIYNAQQ